MVTIRSDKYCYECKCRDFVQHYLKRSCVTCGHDINQHEFRTDESIIGFAAQEFAKHGQI